MPIMYFGSKISPNLTKTPEGYLICHNVPIARTGWQEYLPSEIGLQGREGETIQVYRSPEEVFDPATIASFEGKPVTAGHPPNLVDLQSVGYLAKGHAQNVRRGKGDESDMLIADLYITDANLAEEVESGRKREVSCGYMARWVEAGDHYEQKEIRGNHVAIVSDGRAGERVAIKDESPKNKNTERRKEPMGKISKELLAALGFKQYAQDAEPEQIAEAMKAMKDEGEKIESPAEEREEDNKLQQILESIKQLEGRITALEQSDKEVHKELGAEETLDALEKEVAGGKEKEDGEEPETEESGVIEDEAGPVSSEEDRPENPIPGADTLAFVKAMRPAILAIKDPADRKAVADAFVKIVKDSRPKGANGYAAILNAVNSRKAAKDSKPQDMHAKLAQFCDSAKAMNPHYKKA